MFTIDEQLKSYVGLSNDAVRLMQRRELSKREQNTILKLTEAIRTDNKKQIEQRDLTFLTAKLIEQRESAFSDLDKEFLQFSLEFALRGYAHKNRKDGLPYFAHPYKVAKLLGWLPAGYISIIGGLLHDWAEERENIDKPARDKWHEWFKGLIAQFKQEYSLFSTQLFDGKHYKDLKFEEGLETSCEVIARMTRRPKEKETYFLYLNELLGIGQTKRKMNNATRDSIGRAANVKLMDRIDNFIDFYVSITADNNLFTIDDVNYNGFKNMYYWNLVEFKLKKVSEENKHSAQFQRLKQVNELLRQISAYVLDGIVKYIDETRIISLRERDEIKDRVLDYIATADATKINLPEAGNEFEGTVRSVYLPAFKGEKTAYRERTLSLKYRDAFLFGEYFRQSKFMPSLLGIKNL
ncbi:hypothetical protein HZA96_05045 [Candidatus Woesearchaeota archaeon]|nr:hypothetical protein [Candidatus Woesearchaeota archaeon]